MSKDSILFGIAGIFFGLLVGWIIGSQQAGPVRQDAQAAAPPNAASPQQTQTAAPLDEKRAAELQASAERDPKDVASRVQLANLYFDAERFDEASRWYEDALKIDPRNVNASTDLGITYYYRNQPDRALKQFEHSLGVDPKHSKTLLNLGIVRAFAKQDLEGAAKAWQSVLEIAPDSPEGRAAKQALDGLRNAHPDVGKSGAGSKPGSSN